MEAILVYITAGSAEEAERIATTLLEQRLVACVNTVHGVESRYWWHGALERAEESLLLAKTVRDCWPRLLAAVREIHSYEVFDAVAIPILEGEPAYLEWIRESTAREAVC
ncbi:MAG: divalent-cation tolerance protein CutA [Armatimonadetes bacterium]|nr:divalent-cation tolerance protein CutA [Armatimonadota bacterium]